MGVRRLLPVTVGSSPAEIPTQALSRIDTVAEGVLPSSRGKAERDTGIPMTQDERRDGSRRDPVASDELLRQILAACPDPVVVLQDDRYRFVSPAFHRVFGYSHEDVEAGLSFYALVDDADKPAVRRRYEERLAGTAQLQTFQIHLVAKDGSRVYCETSAAQIELDGRPADLVVIRDITERLRADEDLIAKRRTLDTLAEFEQRVPQPDLGRVLQHGLEFIATAIGSSRVSVALVATHREGVNLVTVTGDGQLASEGTFIPAESASHVSSEHASRVGAIRGRSAARARGGAQ
jgi:PAS domain S-box-containing protein